MSAEIQQIKPPEFIELGQEYLTKYYKSRSKNIHCGNCGEKGHIIADCPGPITSHGLIAFKVVNSPEEELYDTNDDVKEILQRVKIKKTWKPAGQTEYPKIKFLMVQRKDTIGYIDALRGKYETLDDLKNLIAETLQEERDRIRDCSFKELWNDLWLNHTASCYKRDYKKACEKFTLMRPEMIKLMETTPVLFEFKEWSFPKGRRDLKEQNIECAQREFREESGYSKKHYKFIKDYPIIKEQFTGTNNVNYKHIYYLVKMNDIGVPPPRVNPDDLIQQSEISNVAWLTEKECKALIRLYDNEKIKIVDQVYKGVLGMGNDFQVSNIYQYFPKRRRSPKP